MNHYGILGVSKTASQEEIKEAYKNLIKKYHPDIYQGDKSFAEKKTKEINIAYDILSNPESRQEYDEEITPTPTYNYTPPNYTPPSAYSYENYKRYSSYNNYDYQQRRYSNYHRSKTPNSNYSQVNRMHDEFSNNIVNSIDKMSLKFKLKILIIILILYFFILVMSFLQINSILNGETTGTILNTKKKTTLPNNITNTQELETPNNSSPKSKEEFNINDYFSDSELYELYREYYYDDFSTYSEFKSALSDYIYSNYSF